MPCYVSHTHVLLCLTHTNLTNTFARPGEPKFWFFPFSPSYVGIPSLSYQPSNDRATSRRVDKSVATCCTRETCTNNGIIVCLKGSVRSDKLSAIYYIILGSLRHVSLTHALLCLTHACL